MKLSFLMHLVGEKKHKIPPLKYKKTLNDDEMIAYIDSVKETVKEGAQLYRANHGGGMPCPDNVCATGKLFDDL